MDFPRYKFAKETEPELLQFLKIVKEKKFLNGNIDQNKHKVWSKLLPFDPIALKKLNESEMDNKTTIIDLSSDEESVDVQSDLKENFTDNEITLSEQRDKSNISDIAFAIKENLETKHDLSKSLKENLADHLLSDELEELFGFLATTLNSEEVFYLGHSIQNNTSNNLVTLFCRYLLVPRITKEYSDNLLTLVQQYSTKHSTTLTEELLSKLHKLDEQEVKIFLQFMNGLNLNYKSALLSDFIFTIQNLSETGLVVIENLINCEVKYEALNKLVEMLSNIAEDHSKDKAFGKLLMNIVQFLGSNVILLEKPLKHMIAGHKSVWSSKLEKTFNTCYEDSSMFTQSFRD